MPDNDKSHELEVAKSRREFLKKAGKYALYTPPAVMLMVKPSHAWCTKTGGCGNHDHVSDLVSRVRAKWSNVRQYRQDRPVNYRQYSWRRYRD